MNYDDDNSSDTKTPSRIDSVSIIRKAIKNELMKKESGGSSWQEYFGADIEEMVSSFLDFPPSIPQEFRDRQFARHLLWQIGDNRKEINKLLLAGAIPADFDFLWKRLMPFVTGEAVEEVSNIDRRYMRLSVDLFKIIQDYLVLRESDFDELLERIIHAINVARYIYNDSFPKS